MNKFQVFDSKNNIIIPDWPAPDYVRAVVTTRTSFHQAIHANRTISGYDYFNLALHVNDTLGTVLNNRKLLSQHIGIPASDIAWLEQVHGTEIAQTELIPTPAVADACTSTTINQACSIMTADCLPVLFCEITNKPDEKKVAAAHAGWRGLADGILSLTLSKFSLPSNVIAWLGPAISQKHFEVGQEVYDAFVTKNKENQRAFIPSPNTDHKEPKWLASLVELAKIELIQQGIKAVYGGNYCTYTEADLFYSYRRDGAQSGRMASLIMITN